MPEFFAPRTRVYDIISFAATLPPASVFSDLPSFCSCQQEDIVAYPSLILLRYYVTLSRFREFFVNTRIIIRSQHHYRDVTPAIHSAIFFLSSPCYFCLLRPSTRMPRGQNRSRNASNLSYFHPVLPHLSLLRLIRTGAEFCFLTNFIKHHRGGISII